jgi:hypothetical protein
MAIPFDLDLPIFVWSMGKVIFGAKKRLQQAQRAIPVVQNLAEVPAESLDQGIKDYIRPFDEHLATLNYFPDCTFRVLNFKNFGRNLARHYYNAADFASCTLTIVEIRVKVNGVENIKTAASISFKTGFSNGTILTTRNSGLKTLMDHPSYSILQQCLHTTNLAELKRRHDVKVVELTALSAPLPPPAGVEAVFATHHSEHKKFSQFQVERGLYRLLPNGDAYELTPKAYYRGVWNHFNPLAKRIELLPMLLAGLLGCVLPLMGILKFGPHVSQQFGQNLAAGMPFVWLTIAAFYVVAGIFIGAISERPSFPWTMLISYVPTHLLAEWSFGWWPYSTFMFVTSFYVIRERRKKKSLFAA